MGKEFLYELGTRRQQVMWTKNPALLAVKRSRTPEYHWRSVAPLPYHNPRKKNQKENRIATSELQSVPRQKHFSPHVCSALFFLCFVWYVSILHHMGGRNTLHSSTTQRGGGCVVAQGPRGRLPDMSSGSQEGQTKWNQKNRQKVGEEERACEHIAIGTRFAFFFLLCFSAHHRHCRLELRGVGVQRCLYGRSALSCSNVNVPFTIQPGLRRSAPTTLHLFLLLLLGARGKDLIHLRYSNPQRHTPALIRSFVSLP